MTDYYDVVLGLIPVTAALVAAALLGAGADLSLAVSAGSLVSVGIMGHAMFVRAPGCESAIRTAARSTGPADSTTRSNQSLNSAD
jgi:hypothetical protein